MFQTLVSSFQEVFYPVEGFPTYEIRQSSIQYSGSVGASIIPEDSDKAKQGFVGRKNNTWIIRPLVDESFVPATQRIILKIV